MNMFWSKVNLQSLSNLCPWSCSALAKVVAYGILRLSTLEESRAHGSVDVLESLMVRFLLFSEVGADVCLDLPS